MPTSKESVTEASSTFQDRFQVRILGLHFRRESPVDEGHRWRSRRLWPVFIGSAVIIGLMTLELRSSWFEAHVFAAAASSMRFSIAVGASRAIHYPSRGPYDQRLGYARLPQFMRRLESFGYQVEDQARDSTPYLVLTRMGLYPVYHEKTQAGLRILDRDGKNLYSVRYPVRAYSNASQIPPLISNTLMFIENHNLLDSRHPYRNPAVQWSRLSRAVVRYGIHEVDHNAAVIGGSTLATQLEKIRHSPRGETHSARDKFWQMASASLRAYEDGPETLAARREILCDYINSIPLAGSTQGEVTGLGDGLWAWYGADFARVNRLLRTPESSLGKSGQEQRARAYRQALSLFLATRAPSHYLAQNPARLARQTDRYLHALHTAGIISGRLYDLALREKVFLRPQPGSQEAGNFVTNKAPNLIRAQLLPLLGLHDVYALDRLDLSVVSSIDSEAQQNVTVFLRKLADPAEVEKENLRQYQLLAQGDPRSVIYSFTLYEREPGLNLLRVQTDNYNEPLSINEGTRLQLGSTAKLRTLIEYLQIVERLHDQYAAMSPVQLKALPVQPDDKLPLWAIQYLSRTADKSLTSMLSAALDRTYSASPDEGFFTAGGLHYFDNFEPSENVQVLSVSDAFEHSVNLVFIRLMRDIERYYWNAAGPSTSVRENLDAKARQRYLARFADEEGKIFLTRFYEKYRGQSPDKAVDTLLRGIPRSTRRASVIYRSIYPHAGLGQFSVFMQSHFPQEVPPEKELGTLYTKYGPEKFDLADRGYLAHIHPLELWLLNYLQRHPHASVSEVIAQSAPQRQEVYGWLFHTKYRGAQDRRIRVIMEEDAFQHIWHDWRELGYPFDALVPSYATAIGVSGDTPAALAELMGIIVNGGVRAPTIIISQLHFAQDTPIETILTHQPSRGERVLSPEIAGLIRKELIGVVEKGTGRRAQGGLILPDGTVQSIGGKTGTGDNRFKVFDASGHLLGSRAVNRTAAFVFMIGDRFYGTVTAFVPGKTSDTYKFTSALAVQVLKSLEPELLPLFQTPAGEPTRRVRLALAVPTGKKIRGSLSATHPAPIPAQ